MLQLPQKECSPTSSSPYPTNMGRLLVDKEIKYKKKVVHKFSQLAHHSLPTIDAAFELQQLSQENKHVVMAT